LGIRNALRLNASTPFHSGVLQRETLTLQLIDGMRTDGDVYGLLNVPHVDALLLSHGPEIGAIWFEYVAAATKVK